MPCPNESSIINKNLLIGQFTFNLKWKTDFKCIYQGIARIVDTNNAEEHAEPNDEVVFGYFLLIEQMPLDLDVEIARPDKAEHCASEAANETHQNGEVGNENGHQYGGYNDADTEAQTPNLQFPVQIPDGWKFGFWRTSKEVAFEQLTGSIVGQGVAQKGLDDQKEVHHALKALRVQIVGNHLLCIVLEGQKADIPESGLKHSSRYVRPVQHPVEFGAIDHVALERGQKDLGGVREDDDAQ